MDGSAPFRWARPQEPRNPEPFAAVALAGFTLVELLIVLATVAILAAIALPTYQAQIRKGNRAAAQSYMMDLAQREAQYLLDARAYASTEAALGYTATPADVASHYTIGIAAPVVAPPAFTITATAIGAQVADGDLTIDNQGAKTPSGKW
jgi:type IV pilus assembly protein PilE